jgi:hypothetical protein
LGEKVKDSATPLSDATFWLYSNSAAVLAQLPSFTMSVCRYREMLGARLLADLIEAELTHSESVDSGVNETVRRAFELVPPAPKGVLGDELAKKLGITSVTLRKHVVPELKRLGVVNVRGVGYQRPTAPM